MNRTLLKTKNRRIGSSFCIGCIAGTVLGGCGVAVVGGVYNAGVSISNNGALAIGVPMQLDIGESIGEMDEIYEPLIPKKNIELLICIDEDEEDNKFYKKTVLYI